MQKLVACALLLAVPTLVSCGDSPAGTEPTNGGSGGTGAGVGGQAGNGGTGNGGTGNGGTGNGGTGNGGTGNGGTGNGGTGNGGTGNGASGGTGAVDSGGAGATSGGAGSAGAQGPGGTGSGGAPTVLPPCDTNDRVRCTGQSPITCNLGGKEGDYLVTVDVGGPTASSTYVEAESYRRVLANIELGAGQTRRFAFGVNVRNPEGQPIQDAPAGTPGLQLYLRGAAPQLTAVCAKPFNAKPKLWIAGDSTVCDQNGTDYAGWGQHLPQHFTSPVVVANYADSGESSTSVLASAKLWGAIKAGWRAGDWVLVQVGHNDKSITPSAFRSNILTFVTQAKTAGVKIVLCTPIARVGYTLEAQHQSSAGADLPQIIRDVAKSENVPLIDLTKLTWDWLQTVDWKKYFALGTDRTHTNPAGAEVVAGIVRDAIRDQDLELASFIR